MFILLLLLLLVLVLAAISRRRGRQTECHSELPRLLAIVAAISHGHETVAAEGLLGAVVDLVFVLVRVLALALVLVFVLALILNRRDMIETSGRSTCRAVGRRVGQRSGRRGGRALDHGRWR